MRIFSVLALSLAAVLGITFAILNAQLVSIDYYIGSREVPLPLLLLGALVLGSLLGMLSLLPKLIRLKCEIQRLRRKEGI